MKSEVLVNYCPMAKNTLIECYFKQNQIQKQRIDMIIPNIDLMSKDNY